ncbi:MAG: NUDIX hydrolase [Patescibacteria group bacterium]
MNPRSYRKPLVPENAKRVFEGEMFDVYQWEQKLYDGTTATFEKISRPDTAVVFPILEDGRILIVEDSQPQRESVLTAVSGRIETGETPEEAARRELLEETGFEAESLESFFTVTPVEKADWINYVFIAKGCKKIQDPQPDAGEKIVSKFVSFDELIALASDGLLRGKDFTIMALQAKLDPEKMKLLREKFTK